MFDCESTVVPKGEMLNRLGSKAVCILTKCIAQSRLLAFSLSRYKTGNTNCLLALHHCNGVRKKLRCLD